MGFYEIQMDIQAIFWFIFCITEYSKKIPKNYENIISIS